MHIPSRLPRKQESQKIGLPERAIVIEELEITALAPLLRGNRCVELFVQASVLSTQVGLASKYPAMFKNLPSGGIFGQDKYEVFRHLPTPCPSRSHTIGKLKSNVAARLGAQALRQMDRVLDPSREALVLLRHARILP